MSDLDLSNLNTAAVPAKTSPLVLTAPEPVPAIEPAQASDAIAVPDEARTAIEQKAHAFVKTLAAHPLDSPQFHQETEQFDALGRKEIRESTAVTNRLLEQPAVRNDDSAPQARAAKSLGELRVMATELDPHRADLTGGKRLFKFLPSRVRHEVDSYFARYESAQTQLDAILRALTSNQDELRKNNADLQLERHSMWNLMGKLKEYILLLDTLKASLTEEIANQRAAGNTALADALERDALYAATQRHQSLMSSLAIAQQSYMMFGVVQTGNKELIRGLEEASTDTMTVLRTAVILSQALSSQKIALTQIKGLRDTTESMMLANAQALRQQSVEIQEQAAATAISPEALEQVYDVMFDTLNVIDDFRVKSIDTMGQSAEALRSRIVEAGPYMERSNRDLGGQVAGIEK